MEAVYSFPVQGFNQNGTECSWLSREFTLSLIYCAFPYQMWSCFSKCLTALVPADAVEFWTLSRRS